MTSLPNLDQFTELHAVEREVGQAPTAANPPLLTKETLTEEADYEIVLDRRQLAGIGLVAMVLLAVFSGLSYSIGKSTAVAPVVAASPVLPAVKASVKPAPPAPPPPPAPREQPRAVAPPLFAEAVPGQEYLQVGLTDKGSAGTWAEGLRTHGLNAFVAPGLGPGQGLWRVLVGPLPDSKGFQQAKQTLDALGVPNFGRTN